MRVVVRRYAARPHAGAAARAVPVPVARGAGAVLALQRGRDQRRGRGRAGGQGQAGTGAVAPPRLPPPRICARRGHSVRRLTWVAGSGAG